VVGYNIDEDLNLRLGEELSVGKWRTLDGKGESGLMSDSELLSGSPRLCQLRTTSCWPYRTSFDYALTHEGFIGSCKPSSLCNYLVKP
jgi:hypothetical protein